MRIRATLCSLLLAGALTGCAGEDEEFPTGPDPTQADGEAGEIARAAASLDLSCEFDPQEDPAVSGLGSVTLIGTNTTDTLIDQLSVTVSIAGTSGPLQLTRFVHYVAPEESFSERLPVTDQYDGQAEEACTVVEVTGSHFDDDELIEPEGSTCGVTGAPGSWRLTADIAGIEGAPFAEPTFVGVVAFVAGERIGFFEQEVAAGESTVPIETSAEDEPTCSVRYVRDL